LNNIHEVNMTRNPCKLIMVLAACAVPLVAAIVNAEQTDHPLGQSGALVNNRATQDYLNSLNPQRKRDQDEAARAEALDKAADKAAAAPQRINEQSINARGVNGLGAEEGPGWSARTPDTADHGWIVVLAVAGLASSLAAAAYVVWSRSQRVQEPVTVLMPHARPHTSDTTISSPAAGSEARPERRAA
jgi:hypothetical protein